MVDEKYRKMKVGEIITLSEDDFAIPIGLNTCSPLRKFLKFS